MRNRNISLDILRVIACMFVVLMHSPIPSDNANGVFLIALSYFTAPCIGLFFMISGTLLLPVSDKYTIFLGRRFGKMIVPTLFWTAVYIGLNIYNEPKDIDLTRTVLSIPFSVQGHGVLWFMYTLAGLYLLAPVISAWLEKVEKKDLDIMMALWGVTLCFPILELWVDIDEGKTGIAYYFSGYAGYLLLGFYIKKYLEALSLLVAIAIAALGVVVLLITKLYGVEVDFYRMFWYLSIFVVAMCVAVWEIVVRIVRRYNIKKSNFIHRISKLSFGIYFCHILIMREFLWKADWILTINNYILQTVLVFILTFLFSIAFCELISQLPFARFLIGYKKN